MIFTRVFFITLFVGFTAAASAGAEMPGKKRVAFTIDDGPIPEQMPEFLALFAKEGIHVSFAHVGEKVAAHPKVTASAAAAGHEIVNHSRTHAHFKQLDEKGIIFEVTETDRAIAAATGEPTRWFWPPYLEMDDRIAATVQKAGQKPYPRERFHFLSSEDWNLETDADTIRRRATNDVRDLTVILFHEWRPETLSQMPGIIAELKRQGCEFLTFSELESAAN